MKIDKLCYYGEFCKLFPPIDRERYSESDYEFLDMLRKKKLEGWDAAVDLICKEIEDWYESEVRK
uniref:Uncharacterized protein n=1 Tax=viral metagenome TaxID=1070528 RepID=A0A6M3LBB8_9ZZZZ